MVFAGEGVISIDGPVGALEISQANPKASGRFAGRNLIAVICHPHPLHGGTMNNKVVTTLERVYRELGIACVRFNFRGVGRSAGSFDNGEGELADTLAVIDWLRVNYPSAQLLLAGFSFGSAMAAQAAHIAQPQHLLLVAPPVERYRFDQSGQFSCPVCVIQGSADERVNVLGVYSWVSSLKSVSKLIRVADACHFFHGQLSQLKTELIGALTDQLVLTESAG